MPVNYYVKAAIINESKTKIERYAAKIVQVSKHTDDEYLKTYPLTNDLSNLSHLSALKEDLDTHREPFLGISFLSYGFISFIHFTSNLRLFHLEKGDEIEFFFENGQSLLFKLHSPRTPDGLLSKNVHPVKDSDLEIMRSSNLSYWKITNSNKLSLTGGFVYHDHNKQYRTGKTGQRIFRLMAESILLAKEQLTKQI